MPTIIFGLVALGVFDTTTAEPHDFIPRSHRWGHVPVRIVMAPDSCEIGDKFAVFDQVDDAFAMWAGIDDHRWSYVSYWYRPHPDGIVEWIANKRWWEDPDNMRGSQARGRVEIIQFMAPNHIRL